MSADKILHKLQGQINDLAPTLETFVEYTIQPSVSDCEILQKQLTDLQESLAIYKYNKQNKEISPSFNIHAKVSAQETPVEKAAEPLPQIKNVVAEEKKDPEPVQIPQPETRQAEPEWTAPVKPKHPMAIGLNDKFRFINTLFSQNASEYNIALEQLGNLSSWHETEVYLNSLKNLYDWKENNDAVKHFYSIAKKRFD